MRANVRQPNLHRLQLLSNISLTDLNVSGKHLTNFCLDTILKYF